MRTTTWYYLQVAEGRFVPLTGKEVRAFQAGERGLRAQADGHVRYVQLYIQWENRRPAALHGSEFLKFPVSAAGLFEQGAWSTRISQMLLDSVMDLTGHEGSNLIDASRRFAERRYRHMTAWQPTPRDVTALSLLVRQRLQKAIAGR